jgi:hypothetical protein
VLIILGEVNPAILFYLNFQTALIISAPAFSRVRTLISFPRRMIRRGAGAPLGAFGLPLLLLVEKRAPYGAPAGDF